jgi:putative transcriptional regulator
MNKQPTTANEHDRFGMTAAEWARLESMTDDEALAAALADPDAQPISQERLAAAAMRPRSLAKIVRHKLAMSREDFASAYGIPLDTLAAWERGLVEPSPAETAYLRLIACEPDRAKLTTVAAAAAR